MKISKERIDYIIALTLKFEEGKEHIKKNLKEQKNLYYLNYQNAIKELEKQKAVTDEIVAELQGNLVFLQEKILKLERNANANS